MSNVYIILLGGGIVVGAALFFFFQGKKVENLENSNDTLEEINEANKIKEDVRRNPDKYKSITELYKRND